MRCLSFPPNSCQMRAAPLSIDEGGIRGGPVQVKYLNSLVLLEKVLDAGNPAMQSSSNRSWAIPPWDIEALEADLIHL
jgi:hypothetical protein